MLKNNDKYNYYKKKNVKNDSKLLMDYTYYFFQIITVKFFKKCYEKLVFSSLLTITYV